MDDIALGGLNISGMSGNKAIDHTPSLRSPERRFVLKKCGGKVDIQGRELKRFIRRVGSGSAWDPWPR